MKASATISALALFLVMGANAQSNDGNNRVSGFNASPARNGITITWSTASETNNAGFILSRSVDDSSSFVPIASYQGAPELEGLGTSPSGTGYHYTDNSEFQPGHTYYYRLQAVALDGTVAAGGPIASVTASIMSAAADLKAETFLGQNIPNPVHSMTRIPFSVAEPSTVRLRIFDAQGQELAGRQLSVQAGMNTIDLNLSACAAGSYLYKLEVGERSFTRTMTVVR
jgi:hypothetical protein